MPILLDSRLLVGSTIKFLHGIDVVVEGEGAETWVGGEVFVCEVQGFAHFAHGGGGFHFEHDAANVAVLYAGYGRIVISSSR